MGCATGTCTHPRGPTACPVYRWTLESGGGRPAPEEETRRPRNPTRDGVFARHDGPTIRIFSDFVGPLRCHVCETLIVRAQRVDGADVDLTTAAPEIIRRQPCPEGCRHDILTVPLTAVHVCPHPHVSQDQG